MHKKNTRYVSIKIVKEKVFNSKIELLFPCFHIWERFLTGKELLVLVYIYKAE